MEIIRQIENEQKKDSLPEISVGDQVKVDYRIKEGSRERIQVFEGTFLLHSPRVEDVKVIRRGKARRARLFYLRGRVGKAAKLREKTDY